jgi:hypothetical protein
MGVTLVGYNPAQKHQTRVKVAGSYKHASLLYCNNIYGRIKALQYRPRVQCYKKISIRNLRIFLISQSVCPWQAFLA